MKTYDLIFFDIHEQNPDSVALMYPVAGGKWAKSSELEAAEQKIEQLRQALINLRSCDINLATTTQLNNTVDRILRICK